MTLDKCHILLYCFFTLFIALKRNVCAELFAFFKDVLFKPGRNMQSYLYFPALYFYVRCSVIKKRVGKDHFPIVLFVGSKKVHDDGKVQN